MRETFLGLPKNLALRLKGHVPEGVLSRLREDHFSYEYDYEGRIGIRVNYPVEGKVYLFALNELGDIEVTIWKGLSEPQMDLSQKSIAGMDVVSRISDEYERTDLYLSV